MLLMFLDKKGHVKTKALGIYDEEVTIQAILDWCGTDYPFNEHQNRQINLLIAGKRVEKHVSYTVTTRHGPATEEERQKNEKEEKEVNAKLSMAMGVEYKKVQRG